MKYMKCIFKIGRIFYSDYPVRNFIMVTDLIMSTDAVYLHYGKRQGNNNVS